MPLHGELARQRAAAAVLDHVAEPLHRRGLADDAAVELFAARLERLHDAHGAVDRRPFFVAGDQQRHRATMLRMRRARTPRWPPPSPQPTSSCRPRRGRTAARRGASARTGRCATGRAGRWARRRCGRRTPPWAPAACRGESPTGCSRPHLLGRTASPRSESPSGCSRSAISAWQPPSAGVTEARAISASSRRSVELMARIICDAPASHPPANAADAALPAARWRCSRQAASGGVISASAVRCAWSATRTPRRARSR